MEYNDLVRNYNFGLNPTFARLDFRKYGRLQRIVLPPCLFLCIRYGRGDLLRHRLNLGPRVDEGEIDVIESTIP